MPLSTTTIVGPWTYPDSNGMPLLGTFTARYQTSDGTIRDPAADKMMRGPIRYDVPKSGVLNWTGLYAFPQVGLVPADDLSLLLTFEPKDKKEQSPWSVVIDNLPAGTVSLDELTDVTGVPVTSSIAAQAIAARDEAVAAKVAAETASAAAVAVGTTNDTVIAGRVNAAGSATDVALKAKYASKNVFINVKDYGAVADGVVDDAAAINSAIAASGWPGTRATVFFPPGLYKVNSAITVNGGGLLSTPNLDMVGWGAKIVTTTPGITMLDIINSVVSLTRVRVRGFQLYVNAASTAIRLNNAQFVILDELDILGNFGLGVKIEGSSTYATISSCTFSNLARGIHITGNAQYVNITGNHFGEQTAGSPLNWIQADTTQTPNGSIIGNTFYGEGNTLPAVNLVQGVGWTITGNKFAFCSDTALWIGRDGVSYGHMVVGNTFQSNGKDDIVVDGGKRNSIVGNTFGTKKAGTPASTYCNVTILNTTGGTAGSENTVSGNTSIATGTALLASFSAHASCQNVAFIGNQYAIAQVNANTSAAVFGRDGVQVPTGKEITKDGIGYPNVLARVTNINAKTVAATTLYTVPTGKTAVITGAVVQSGAVTAITAGPTLGIGIAAGEDDIYTSTALTGLTSNAKTHVFAPPGLQASAPAGSVIKVGIDTASTGTAQVVTVSLLGYLI